MYDGLRLTVRCSVRPCFLGFFLFLGCLQNACAGGNRSAVPIPSSKPASGGIYHEVQAGQTLWSIAQAYKVDVQTLIRVNHIAPSVYTGQQLYIPGATRLQQVASRCPCAPAPTPVSFSPTVPSPAVRPTSSAMQAKFTPLPPSPVPRALPHESSTFIWPTQGEISRDFDHQASRRHDGIDISAPQGTAIYAAADGEVIFSDWGPGGYGYMVIVQHQADMVTIYAHNQENLVNVGQRVRQGERIATVGKSGRATGYHLHFEVRRNATPISPYSLLPRRPDRLAALDRG